MKRILFLSSLLFLASCARKSLPETSSTLVKNDCLSTLKPDFQSVLYSTQVYITSHYLSGLVVMKKMGGDTTRIVFTNEMGLTYFDFELTDQDFNVKYCINKLNKKIVLNELRDIFQLILMTDKRLDSFKELKLDSLNQYCIDNSNEQICYYTDLNCTNISMIETAKKQNKKVLISLEGLNKGLAKKIDIKYLNFKFNIILNQSEGL
jgi:hypothetical protein